MRKILAVITSWLWPALLFAQTTAPAEPEPVSPIVTYAFLIIFFGGIIGVGVYMWRGDRAEKAAAEKNKK